MTKRDKGMRFHLSFPNVSIGNPESSKRNGFPVKLGMTEREWIPDQVGDDRENGDEKKSAEITKKDKMIEGYGYNKRTLR